MMGLDVPGAAAALIGLSTLASVLLREGGSSISAGNRRLLTFRRYPRRAGEEDHVLGSEFESASGERSREKADARPSSELERGGRDERTSLAGASPTATASEDHGENDPAS